MCAGIKSLVAQKVEVVHQAIDQITVAAIAADRTLATTQGGEPLSVKQIEAEAEQDLRLLHLLSNVCRINRVLLPDQTSDGQLCACESHGTVNPPPKHSTDGTVG